MAKAKAAKAAKAKPDVDVDKGLEKGDRVKVLRGDWGNSRGVLVSLSAKGKTARVKLDQDADNDTERDIELDNLEHAIGTGDRL